MACLGTHLVWAQPCGGTAAGIFAFSWDFLIFSDQNSFVTSTAKELGGAKGTGTPKVAGAMPDDCCCPNPHPGGGGSTSKNGFGYGVAPQPPGYKTAQRRAIWGTEAGKEITQVWGPTAPVLCVWHTLWKGPMRPAPRSRPKMAILGGTEMLRHPFRRVAMPSQAVRRVHHNHTSELCCYATEIMD